jgi:hypothetical protein
MSCISKQVEEQLKMVAESTPILFDWIMIPTPFLGEDLNLTPLAKEKKFNKGEVYHIPMPHLFSEDPIRIFRAAYLRGGFEQVKRKHAEIVKHINRN